MFSTKTLSLCALTATSLLHAGGCGDCCEEYNVSLCDMTQCNAQGMVQPITAYHGIEGGFTFDVSFLYWRAAVDNLEFAVKAKNSVNIDFTTLNNSVLSVKARPTNIDFRWEPGFNVGLGYISCCDQWKARLDYTRLKTNDNKGSDSVSSLTGNNTNSLDILWFPSFIGQRALSAKGRWDLTFNQVDLVLGRDFFLSKCISMNPYLGLRWASLDQDFRVNYGSAFIEVNTGSVNESIISDGSIKFNGDYWGVGFNFGSSFSCHFGCGFSLTGDVGGSLIYGEVDITQRVNGRFATDAGGTVFFPTVNLCISDDFYSLRGNFETELGVEWEAYFCCDSMRLSLGASYFFSNWFNQNHFLNLFLSSEAGELNPTQAPVGDREMLTRKYGDLNMQGLIIKAGFDF